MKYSEAYKVIKDCEEINSLKGDVFEKNGNDYKCVKSNEDYTATVIINKEYIDELVEEGVMIDISACDSSSKIEDLKEYVDNLIMQYTKDHNDMLTAFNDGDVQPCLKVEAETVYFNLIKVLNSIKSKLDE